MHKGGLNYGLLMGMREILQREDAWRRACCRYWLE